MPNFSTWLISPRQRLHGATKAAYLGLNAGYIHRVRLTGTPQRHDLNWLLPMQMALFKEKYRIQYPERSKHYPEWTDALIEECCAGYWSGEASDSPVWECLALTFIVE